jgi:casein kinase I family protein HRR25
MADSSARRLDLRVGGNYRLGKKIGSGLFGTFQTFFIQVPKSIRDPLSQDISLSISIIPGKEVAMEFKSVTHSPARHNSICESGLTKPLPPFRSISHVL